MVLVFVVMVWWCGCFGWSGCDCLGQVAVSGYLLIVAFLIVGQQFKERDIIIESFNKKPRKNAVVEYLDYQIPVTQLKGQKGNGDMQTAKRD